MRYRPVFFCVYTEEGIKVAKFKSISELEHYIKNMVNIALDTSVKEGVVQGLIGHAGVDVYDVYPAPSMYERRGSLLSEGNYEVDRSENMKLSITPVARFNASGLRFNKKTHSFVPTVSSNGDGNELAGLINYGDGWNGYSYEYVNEEEMENPSYTAPRPFIDNTVEELNGGVYKALLALGLEDLGITVK